MDVKNCKKCGRIFNYALGPVICPACKESMEEKFQEVKKFIQQNGYASMNVVSEECDVETSQIQQWIREERLQFSDDSPIKVACESCGKMIGSGRFCEKCKNDMTRGLSSAMSRPNTIQELDRNASRSANSNKMRFLDRDDK